VELDVDAGVGGDFRVLPERRLEMAFLLVLIQELR
jgi:hypothetical protein